MSQWWLRPKLSKSIVEVYQMEKDGNTLYYRLTWRGGDIMVTTSDDNPPVVDLENDDGLDVYDLVDEQHVLEVEVGSLWDGIDSEFEFDGDPSEEEQQAVQDAYDEDGLNGLEDLGWEIIETRVYLHNELEVEPFNGW